MSDNSRLIAEGSELRCLVSGSWLASEIAARLGWKSCLPYHFWTQSICWGATRLTFDFPEHRMEIDVFNRSLLDPDGAGGDFRPQVASIGTGAALRGNDLSTLDVVKDVRLCDLVGLSARMGVVWEGAISGVIQVLEFCGSATTGSDSRFGCVCSASLEMLASRARPGDVIVETLSFADFSSFVAMQDRAQRVIELKKAERKVATLQQALAAA